MIGQLVHPFENETSWRGSEHLGTTADIYTHTTQQAEREAAVALERAYFGDLFPVVPNLGNGNKNDAVN